MNRSERTTPSRSAQHNSWLGRKIPQPAERKRVKISLFAFFATLFIGFALLPTVLHYTRGYETEAFEDVEGKLGSIARIAFFGAISIYPVFLLIRKWKQIPAKIKTYLLFIGKWIRIWHVPIALLGAGIVILHISFVILGGWEWNAQYLLGAITAMCLLPLILLGFGRYKNRKSKWHLIIGITFVILFMLHASV